MRDAAPKTIRLSDYQPPAYGIEQIQLEVDLFDDRAEVRSRLQFARRADGVTPLVLDGQDLELRGIWLDGAPLPADAYSVAEDGLTLHAPPARGTLETLCVIHPERNASLEGLYRSRGMFCTQCEAEGFRKITYYLDRPDVMAAFETTISADRRQFPVLLSNGNCIARGELDGGRHFATWRDPFLKPAYLFALVAGDLVALEDSFTTMSGRQVALQIFVEPKDLDKCDHAMASLKNAMRWDEEVYGREYDLDIFMIVAVDDFNMGAMENKGLNIFNTSCVLAHPATTTDAGFQRVESVVAHEYFHNWSGNRVTCRDWFQLSLKEGFTVFRDAEFSADMNSRTVKRVQDVQLLRTLQFAEDAGPMAHPVQPASYMEISNFYTLTVYEKGAEVVRMIRTLLGAEVFRRGTDRFFDTCDGTAATIEDFVAAMAAVSGRDFSQFMHWYRQAGTPVVSAEGHYDPATRTYTLQLRQRAVDTPEAKAEAKSPYLIPVAMGLVGEGGPLPLQLGGVALGDHTVLELSEPVQRFVFEAVGERPTPSLLRDFSAPVKLECQYGTADLTRLMARDSDGFTRYDASQQLALRALDEAVQGALGPAAQAFIAAADSLLQDPQLDPAMVALMLELPAESYIGDQYAVFQVDAVHRARQTLKRALAEQLRSSWAAAYQRCRAQLGEGVAMDGASQALRALQNTALGYWLAASDADAVAAAHAQYQAARNMTEELAAFTLLVQSERPELRAGRGELIDGFRDKWRHEALVINNWFAVQAADPAAGALDRVRGLLADPLFDGGNPNKLRSVLGVFCNQNLVNFHAEDGSGYALLGAEIQRIDRRNPQIAARLVTPLTKWRRHTPERQAAMRAVLEQLHAAEPSKDLFEVVHKSL